jgi:hypothetical protein
MFISKKNSLFFLFLLIASSTNLDAAGSSWLSSIKSFFTSLMTGRPAFKRPALNKRWVGIGALAIGSYVAWKSWKYFKKSGNDKPSPSDDEIEPWPNFSNTTYSPDNSDQKGEILTANDNQDDTNQEEQDVIYLQSEAPYDNSEEKQHDIQTINTETVTPNQSEKIEPISVVNNPEPEVIPNSVEPDTVNNPDESIILESAKEPETISVFKKNQKKQNVKKQHHFAVGDIVQIIDNTSMRMTPADYEVYKHSNAGVNAQLIMEGKESPPDKLDTDFKDGHNKSIGIIREINGNNTVTVEVRSIGRNVKSKRLEFHDFSSHFTILPTDIMKLNLKKITVKKNKNKFTSNLKEKMFVKIAMQIDVKAVEKALNIKISVPPSERLPENMIGTVKKINVDDQTAKVCYYPHWLAASFLKQTKAPCASFSFNDLKIIEAPNLK